MSHTSLHRRPRQVRCFFSFVAGCLLILFGCSIPLSHAFRGTPQLHPTPIHSHYSKLLAHIYNQTDMDQDGTLSFDDCYERILYFYVHLNRRAAIEPPTRAFLAHLYETAGWRPATKRLTLDEFSQLAHTLLGQAGTRFLVYKVISLLLAPTIAAAVVKTVIPPALSEDTTRATSTKALSSSSFRRRCFQQEKMWLSLVTIACSKQLPRLGVALINWSLRRWQPFVRWFLRPKNTSCSANGQ